MLSQPNLLDNLTVVLFQPKFAENVGSTARACANLGCPNLKLVQPPAWDLERAAPLATGRGKEVLHSLTLHPDLPSALSPHHTVYGTTARTGGWRKAIRTPEQVAEDVAGKLAAGHQVAVVFGPEDRGLSNEEIDICGQLLTIPTASEATSLNLSQAVLLVLYEWFKASSGKRFLRTTPPQSRLCTHEERETLLASVQEALLRLDFFKDDNAAYWMLPVRRFFQRFELRRHEFNLLMGICRQVKWLATRTDTDRHDP